MYLDVIYTLCFLLLPGGFAALDPAEVYPHNLVLEMAVELGVLGAIAVVTMIVIMLRRALRMWQRKRGLKPLFAKLGVEYGQPPKKSGVKRT